MIYEELLRKVLVEGEERHDRTGTGTLSLFGARLEYSLRNNKIPLVTTKKVAWEKAIEELLWMIGGGTSLEGLGSARNIWEPWADPDGNLGPVYGAQWRAWVGPDGRKHDQLRNVVEELRRNPWSRRAVISSWNVGVLGDMALPPCPVLYQFSVRADATLCLEVYQRSADMFIGVPFDIFEMGVLLQLVARELGCVPGKLGWSAGDVHIYMNHIDVVKEQLSREPKQDPKLLISNSHSMFSGKLKREDFMVRDYEPYPRLKGIVAV